MDEAVEMARIAATDGTRLIVATPHWQSGYAAPTGDFLEERTQELRAAVREAGVGVRIEPGAEVAITPALIEAADSGRLPTLAGGRCVLVEALPYADWDLVRHVLFELQIRSVGLVLAHPERTAAIHERYERAAELRAAGVKLQVVASSLAGQSSVAVRRVARRLVRDGLVDLLGSDAHDAGLVSPRLSRVRRVVERLGGAGTFERLTVVAPARIVGLAE